MSALPVDEDGADDDVIELTMHRSQFIPNGNGAILAFSDDFPDRQFLFIPKSALPPEESK